MTKSRILIVEDELVVAGGYGGGPVKVGPAGPLRTIHKVHDTGSAPQVVFIVGITERGIQKSECRA